MNYPFVSLIIVTYLESNQKYLNLALESIENLDYPKDKMEVILCSSGDYEPVYLDRQVNTHSHTPEQRHYPESINRGVSLASRNADHYFILNDDVILTKNSLKELVETAQDMDGIFQPISTCDNQYRYSLQLFTLKHDHPVVFDKRFYRYEDMTKDLWDTVKNAFSIYPKGLLVQDFVAFYATLIPKKVWHKIGTLDPKFKTGQDDIDYCKRAKQQNIGSYVCLSSFVFHFGGVTADQVLSWDIRHANINYYKEKWGVSPI